LNAKSANHRNFALGMRKFALRPPLKSAFQRCYFSSLNAGKTLFDAAQNTVLFRACFPFFAFFSLFLFFLGCYSCLVDFLFNCGDWFLRINR